MSRILISVPGDDSNGIRIMNFLSIFFLFQIALSLLQTSTSSSRCDCTWVSCATGSRCVETSNGTSCVSSMFRHGAGGAQSPVTIDKGLQKASVGQSCELSTQCAPGLFCSRGVCKTRTVISQFCYDSDECKRGATCVQRSNERICMKLLPLNAPCSAQPFTCCGEGLGCQGTSGLKACRPAITLGNFCDSPGMVCGDGLVCDATATGKKICKMLVEPNEPCDKPLLACPKTVSVGAPCGTYTAKCASDLFCETGVCAKRKKLSEMCFFIPDACQAGLSCVALEHNVSVCMKLLDLNASCDPQPYTRCGDGLGCDGKLGHKICRPAKKVGDLCDSPPTLCVDGLVCGEMPNGRRKCKNVVAPFGACDKPLLACPKDYICNNFPGKRGSRECVKPGKAGKSCTLRYPCRKDIGLTCIVKKGDIYFGDSWSDAFKTGVCSMVLQEHALCRASAHTVCDVGLVCARGVCARKTGASEIKVLETNVNLR